MPGRLAPLFMDRAELTAAPILSAAVREAIEASASLVVVCSPSAAGSEWVGREIQLFRETHPGGTILTAICRGQIQEAFHGELLGSGPDGAQEEPIAADFRTGGDGYRLALLKLVAPLAGVRLDALVQRDSHRELRRTVLVAAAAACGLVVASVFTVSLVDAQAKAQQERNRGDKMIAYMLGDERARLKAVGRLEDLDSLNAEALAYYKERGRGQLSDAEIARRAQLLQDMAEDDIARGDFQSADVKVGDAFADTARLLRAQPDDPALIYDHAQSEFWLGFVHRREGDETVAETAFEQYASLANHLKQLKPSDTSATLEQGYADSDLATLLLQRDADTARAGPLFATAQTDFEAVARLRPDDLDAEIQVLDGYAWLADVSRLEGRYNDALTYRLKQQSMLDGMLARDHHNAKIQAHVISNELGMGRIEAARGDSQAALASLQKAHDNASALADLDPSNMDLALQVRATELFKVYVMLSAPPGARASNKMLESILGDCDADAQRPNHAEIAAFCTVLRARVLARGGDGTAAAALRAKVEANPLVRGDRLSERWLIDWRTELAA